MNTPTRCPWALHSPLETAYHDTEWGVPITNDNQLFEFLTLEGAQAGLSWSTILKKREGYRTCFAQFDAEAVARFTENDITRLVQCPDIVRHKLKIQSTITNARALLKVQEQHGSFSRYMWNFVDGSPLINRWNTIEQVPVSTPLSTTIAKDLKKKGFSFVGTTTIYAFMQAVGMVNDHLTSCFRYTEVQKHSL